MLDQHIREAVRLLLALADWLASPSTDPFDIPALVEQFLKVVAAMVRSEEETPGWLN